MANILHVVVRPYYITLACNQITSRGSCSKSRVHDLRPSAAKALEIARSPANMSRQSYAAGRAKAWCKCRHDG